MHRKNQLNRERIAERAIEELRSSYAGEVGPDTKDPKLEADWVDYFWEKAGTVSDEDMQGLWARVLTRRAVGHGISLRTLDFLRTLSVEEAQIIEYLSKFRIAIGPDHRFLRSTIGLLLFPEVRLATDRNVAPDRITVRGNEVVAQGDEKVDFRCRDLIGNSYSHILEPAGVYIDTTRSSRFSLNWNGGPLPMQLGDRHFLVYGLPTGGEDGFLPISFGTGIGFSQIGWELFSFAKAEPSLDYLSILEQKFEQRGLRLETVVGS